MNRLDGPRKTVALTVGTVVLMGSLAWASVPFYSWFCKVTGFGGTPIIRSTGASEVLDQTIKIRFDGSVDHNLSWEFKPVVREMELKIGETGLAFFEAYNPTDHSIAGSASYNVTPYAAGGYFTKIACFCFTKQVLGPHERVQMPVTFYVDPAIVDDPDGKFVHMITLSYTFYQTELPEENRADLGQPAAKTLN